MHARIWAPPRFFLVETPGALAVDLGCVYSLAVAPDGTGLLRVESGQVELVEGTRRALVLAGNAATLRPGRGPGLPYPVAAAVSFRAALARWEALDASADRAPAFGTPVDDATRLGVLDSLLASSTRATTITLWHLLPRVTGEARARAVDRLTELAPPPRGVHRREVLRLDADALTRWREALEPSWTTESVPFWKRAWRRVWATYLTAF
jgi:hypothetical protein